MIRTFVVLVFAASLAPSSSAQSLGAPGCGPESTRFEVKGQSGRQPLPVPEAGKAQVVFLQDDQRFESRPRPTTRFGIDGAWVGATQSDSWFSVSVDAGEHHLCANWQSKVVLAGPVRPTAALRFTAEAGQTYWFVARDYIVVNHHPAEVVIEPLDSDEGQLLANSFVPVSSHPKK